MIVVDASALLECILGESPDGDLLVRVASEELHAPHLVDVELLSAVRSLFRRDRVTSARADAARGDFVALAITRHPHLPLMERMWQLRHNLSAYDASYVALAEALEVPLVTVDARISRAPELRTVIEVFDR